MWIVDRRFGIVNMKAESGVSEVRYRERIGTVLFVRKRSCRNHISIESIVHRSNSPRIRFNFIARHASWERHAAFASRIASHRVRNTPHLQCHSMTHKSQSKIILPGEPVVILNCHAFIDQSYEELSYLKLGQINSSPSCFVRYFTRSSN